jgi:hypothetical protein
MSKETRVYCDACGKEFRRNEGSHGVHGFEVWANRISGKFSNGVGCLFGLIGEGFELRAYVLDRSYRSDDAFCRNCMVKALASVPEIRAEVERACKASGQKEENPE